MAIMPSAPAQRSWLARSLRLGALGLATLLVVLVLAVVWLLSPLGLGFALGQARQFVADGGGILITERAGGSLWGGVQIEHLKWSDGQTSVDLESVQSQWRLTDLLSGRLTVSQLAVGRLSVQLPPAGEPTPRQAIPMPGSLRLPVEVSINQLAVADLVLVSADPQGEPLKFSDLQVALSYADGHYQVSRFDLKSPWADLSQVELRVGADLPHAIELQARVSGEIPASEAEPAKPATVNLTGHGDLEQLRLAAQIRALTMFAQATSTLRPLEVSALTAADLTVSDVGLQKVDATLPQTAIQLSATLRTVDPQGQALPGWLLGLQLENAAAGPLRDKRLPLAGLSLDVSMDDPLLKPVEKIQLRQINLHLPGESVDNPGRVTGQIDIDLSDQQSIVGMSIPTVLAELAVSGLDLSLFAGAELKTAMSGQISLLRNEFNFTLNQAAQSAAERQANPDTYFSSLPPGDASLVARGFIEQDRLRLSDVRMAVGATELAVFGSAQVASPYRLDLGGKIVKLDLNRWIPASVEMPARWRKGTIYGGWTAQGVIEPSADLSVALNIDSSRLAGQPLQAAIRTGIRMGADGKLQSVRALDALLRLGKNRFTAKGGLSGDPPAANGKTRGLKFQLDLNDPAAIEPSVQGKITLGGELTGTLDKLRVGARLNGTRIRYSQAGQPKTSLGSIEADMALPVAWPFAPKSSISLTSRLRNLQAAGQKVSAAVLQIKGTPERHQIDFDTTAAGQKLNLLARGRVELQDSPVWVGTVERIRSSGKLTVRSTQPMELLASAQNIRVAKAELTVQAARSDRGRISITQAVAALGAAPAFTVRGGMSGLPIAELVGAFQAEPLPEELSGLRLSSEFQLSGTGVEDLTGQLSASLNEIRSKKKLRLGGRNEAVFRFKLGQLDGDIDLTLPSLAFSRKFTGPGWVIDGRASLAGVVAGTVAKPTYDVQLTATDLSLLQPSLGWRLDKGVLRAQVSDSKLAIEALRLQSGDGKIELYGQADLLPPAVARRRKSTLPIDGRFELNTDRFVVPIGPGQRLILSGKTELIANREGLSWRGDMNADEGLIEIAGSGAPSLPDDVEVVSANPVAKPAPPAEEPDAGISVATLLNINLGKNLRVQGGGVNARLTGLLQLKGNLPADPRAEGLVKIVDGSYRAYSQDLQINDGDVRFNGPIDNPALNIEASRPKLPVTVGVAIRGTALSPRIELYSDPSMSDAEKLSWLVLGVPIDSAQSGAQSLALKEAASRLLGQDDGSVSGGGFSDKLGLDSLGFGYASETGQAQGVRDSGAPTGLPGAGGQTSASAYQEVVTLGKKLSDRLSVSYEQGVRGLFNLLRVQYELNKRLSLRAQTGSENAVDLLYFWSFD